MNNSSSFRILHSRRRFLKVTTAAGGAAVLASSIYGFQDAFDRAKVDESLKGRLIFFASPGPDPENFGLFAYEFETRKWPRVVEGLQPEWFCRTSPDGKSFAVNEGWKADRTVSIIRPEGRTKVGEMRSRLFWAPDGRQVILSEWGPGSPTKSKTWRMNLDGTGRVWLPIPEDELVLDWSRDGRWLLVAQLGPLRSKPNLLIRRSDGTDPRSLIKESFNVSPGRFSPDARQIAFVRWDQQLKESDLWLIDVETLRERRILVGDADGHPDNAPCWSPDGKYLAVVMLDRKKAGTEQDRRIEILDLQGHRIRRLGTPHVFPVPCDWQ